MNVSQYGLLSEHKEDMVQLNDSENGIIILAASSNLHLLCDPTVTILGDGTFKTCPRFFTQLYILHAFKNSVCVPCVFPTSFEVRGHLPQNDPSSPLHVCSART